MIDLRLEKHPGRHVPVAALAYGIVVLLACMGAIRILVTQTGFGGRPVLYLTRDIPALASINSADIASALSVDPPTGALSDPVTVLGRISTAPLAKGTVLTETRARAVPYRWWLLTVPLGSTPAPQLGDTVVLVGVGATETAAPFVYDGAVVEALISGHVVVALPGTEAVQAVSYLGRDRQLVVLRR
jgi:hypothetical protein